MNFLWQNTKANFCKQEVRKYSTQSNNSSILLIALKGETVHEIPCWEPADLDGSCPTEFLHH